MERLSIKRYYRGPKRERERLDEFKSHYLQRDELSLVKQLDDAKGAAILIIICKPTCDEWMLG